eukprot:COSAG04_NODE_12945_length_627_cov_0.882576_1_plen_66_part_10
MVLSLCGVIERRVALRIKCFEDGGALFCDEQLAQCMKDATNFGLVGEALCSHTITTTGALLNVFGC